MDEALQRQGIRVLSFPETVATEGALAWATTLEGQRVILIEPSLDEVRRRFALAHALAHFMLNHPPLAPDTPECHQTTTCVVYEAAANSWALKYLMPKALVEEVLHYGFVDLMDYCDIFGVSEVAAHTRLRNLGLIGS